MIRAEDFWNILNTALVDDTVKLAFADWNEGHNNHILAHALRWCVGWNRWPKAYVSHTTRDYLYGRRITPPIRWMWTGSKRTLVRSRKVSASISSTVYRELGIKYFDTLEAAVTRLADALHRLALTYAISPPELQPAVEAALPNVAS